MRLAPLAKCILLIINYFFRVYYVGKLAIAGYVFKRLLKVNLFAIYFCLTMQQVFLSWQKYQIPTITAIGCRFSFAKKSFVGCLKAFACLFLVPLARLFLLFL